jgi:hypothetical protein
LVATPHALDHSSYYILKSYYGILLVFCVLNIFFIDPELAS